MGRESRGGTLKNVRSGTGVLVCVFAASLLLSSTTHALSVEPVLDTVISVAKLNETESDTGRDNRRGSSKIENREPLAAPSSSNKSPDAAAGSLPAVSAAPEQIVSPAPIEELPSIDTSAMRPQTLRIYRPATTLTVSHEILGATTPDSVAPLQASTHGWKLFNVAWYWWLLGGVSVFYVAKRMMHLQRQSVISSEQATIDGNALVP